MSIYSRRRKRLMQMMGNDSIAILPASTIKQRNRDVEYPYRPDSDFFYLTGFNEPEAVMVLLPGRRTAEYLLFCRSHDPDSALWNGPMAGLEGASDDFGADDAFPIDDIDDILPGLLEDRKKIFYTMGNQPDFDAHLTEWLNLVRGKSRSGINTPEEIVVLEHFIHEMRLYKERSEITAMRRAAHISANAHKRAMSQCRPGMMEYQLEAELIHEFMSQGCREPAYPSIVGGGANGCILHYTDNNAELKDGDLVLIDAGAEYQGYAGDITRTFPVNGRYSPAQKALYELVLKAQLAAIDKVRPGNHWNDPHMAAVRVLTRGLINLGLLKGEYRTLLKNEAYRRFYMHRTGHWLGMDVHDVGDYKIDGVWRLLEPGMTLTVEPGLYIPMGSRGVTKKWWGIGIRIEDDVLVTHDGCEVMSQAAPKSVAEIEALMAMS
jgi:Xaa-Pro aminopeptidase